jgi:hypothetical protein
VRDEGEFMRAITAVAANPDLVHWRENDLEAWDQAMKVDEILRDSREWAKKPYSDRFDEVVRRVRAIMPEASNPG